MENHFQLIKRLRTYILLTILRTLIMFLASYVSKYILWNYFAESNSLCVFIYVNVSPHTKRYIMVTWQKKWPLPIFYISYPSVCVCYWEISYSKTELAKMCINYIYWAANLVHKWKIYADGFGRTNSDAFVHTHTCANTYTIM